VAKHGQLEWPERRIVVQILMHLMAAYAVLAAPWLGRIWYERAKRRIASGQPDAKVKLYRSLVGEQILVTVVVLGLWFWGKVPAASLGLNPPRSWMLGMGLLIGIVGGLALQSWKLRPKADQIREKIKDSVGALLPFTNQERRWWFAVSVGAGVCEELLFRGFLFYYLALHIPRINSVEKVLLTSVIFALAHIYQGWKPAIGTGFVGLFLATLYALSGSLLFSAIAHAVVDARILLMFPPEASPAPAAVGAA